MPIDRRITNGLAWAGAVLVVVIPAADIALRHFGGSDAPQMAVISVPEDTVLPSPASQRPLPERVAEPDAASITEPSAADPVATASVTPRVAGSEAVDRFLQSGRPLPGYISDGSTRAPSQSAATAVEPETPEPATPERLDTAAIEPQTRLVAFPTPVSERPASVARTVIAPQPPLVVEEPDMVVTADELADWESGPLSDFLANRQSGAGQAAPDYDSDGFFLDQGPNADARVRRFPGAYSLDSYSRY